jgi:hypothetical protein
MNISKSGLEAQNMDANTSESFTRFLDLPREIRDLCYEHMLVRDVIPIECAITKPSSLHNFSVYDNLNTIFPLTAPRIHRRFWLIPIFDMDLDYTNEEESSSVYMTYQLSKQEAVASADSLNLNILQASKQLYAEAFKIFYSNNVFSFTGDYRIPTAFAFLCDRPAASLCLIKSLELALMEDTNMRGTTQAHYPIIRRSTDSLVLQYAYHYFTELCTLLSTQRIQLRTLYLSVETWSIRRSNDAINLQESIAWEKQNLRGTEVPLWLDPLLNIDGLQSIEICWIFRQAGVLRMAHTAQVMQRQMLATAPAECVLGCPNQHVGPTIILHVLQKAESERYPESRGTSKWEEVALDGEEVRYVAQEDIETNKTSQALEVPRHVQFALDLATQAYVCCCTLSCA